jgi:hypothetical protein
MADATARALKTREKTIHGGLPAPVETPPALRIGSGAPCRGCGESITPKETLYAVELLEALTLDFHAECYQSWKTLKPRGTNTA